MPSYAVAGSSRGLGLEFVVQISKTPSNTVFAIVRNPELAERLQELARERPNIHIIHADVKDPNALKEAAATTSKVTGGKLDVLIYNANMYDAATGGVTASMLPADREAVQNVFECALFSSIYGPAWTTNAFLPLIEQGEEKKIVHITSAMADIDFIRKTGIQHSVAYAAGKASMNVLVAKYAAELAPKGIKTLAVSPGWVETHDGNYANLRSMQDNSD